MIVKRYYVADMQEAMAVIRAELGPDAVILSSKPVRKKGLAGLFQKKDLEVVAAYEPRLESPRAREERESAVYHAAIQAVQEAQNRVLPSAPVTPSAPPPSPGQPLGPIDGRSRAQTRSAAQSAALKSALRGQDGQGSAETSPAQQPARQASPAAAPATQKRAAQAAALYNQAANNWEQAESPIPVEEERPAFQRQEAQLAFEPYSPPEMVVHPPGQPPEGRLGDDLMDIEEIDSPPIHGMPLKQDSPLEEDPMPQPEYILEEPALEGIEESPSAEETQDSEGLIENPMEDVRLEALDRKINALSSLIESFAKKYEYIRHDSDYQYDPEIEPYLHKLLTGDVEQELAHALARAVQDGMRGGESPRQVLEELLRGVIGEPAPLVVGQSRPIALFMGPTGVGKTTTLVKLATMCSVRDKRKVGLINTDTYRIAAQEQLRTYAEILGVPLKVVYSAKDLPAAIEEMADREIIFVDTAGKRPGDEQHIEDMQVLIDAAGGSALPFLTVAAPTGQHAMRDLFAHYEFLGEYRLLLTKTDETTGWGAALNACHLSGMPLAYLTGGQSVPDDIEQADTGELIRRLLR